MTKRKRLSLPTLILAGGLAVTSLTGCMNELYRHDCAVVLRNDIVERCVKAGESLETVTKHCNAVMDVFYSVLKETGDIKTAYEAALTETEKIHPAREINQAPQSPAQTL